MSCSVLHHVEICVKDENKLLTLLTQGFGFHPFARRLTPLASKWVLKSGNSIFVVTKRRHTLPLVVQNGQTTCVETDAGSKQNGTINGEQNLDEKSISNRRDKGDFNCDNAKSAITNVEYSYAEDKDSKIRSSSQDISKNHTGVVCNKDVGFENAVQQSKEHWTVFCCRDQSTHTIDSVFNVALVVKNVDDVTNRVRSLGGQVLQEPTDICDDFGRVRYSIVASCCGNIVHTLLDKVGYDGEFLPGYEYVQWCDYMMTNVKLRTGSGNTDDDSCDRVVSGQDSKSSVNDKQKCDENIDASTPIVDSPSCFQGDNSAPASAPISTFIDHVTYVCGIGKSHDLIKWYEHCFGMKRFLTNR